jgi:CubicO group peptidase (beta-lactamase class C family)
MRRSSSLSCAVAVVSALSLASVVRPADPIPEHLAALRLQGPVLIESEPGWTIEQRMREYHVRGVSVAYCSTGTIRWAEGYGFADAQNSAPVTPETLFQAGSISKPVAAAGVMRQVDAGKMVLDRDVNEYLRSWKLPANELTRKRPVTLERILSHSAGLTVHGFPGYGAGMPLPTLPQILDGEPPANTAAVRVDVEPGSKFRYSGGGYTIAQLALADTLGEPFPALLERTVLRPAGMERSSYEQPLPPERLAQAATGYRADGSELPGKRHTYPEMAAAGLWTTPSDLCRFAMSIQRSLRGEEGALLSRAAAERMTTPFSGEAGLGFFMTTQGANVHFGHYGADEGFQAILVASRDRGYAAAVMVNSDNGVQLGDEILRGIAEREGWAGYLPEPQLNLSLPPAERAALVGRYRVNGDEAFDIGLRDGELMGRTVGAPPFALFQVAPDELARRERRTRYNLQRDAAGVTAIQVINPALGDTPEEAVLAPRMAAGERLPSDWLAAGDIAGAVAAYRKLFATSPQDAGVAEGHLNRLGYELAGHQEIAKALAVLELNTELYPDSANTYDSLAEITLASGDRVRALALYRKVLEVLPRDPAVANRELLRSNAEAKIRELS